MKTLNYILTGITFLILTTCYGQRNMKVDIQVTGEKVAIFQAYNVLEKDVCEWKQTINPIYHQVKNNGKFKFKSNKTCYIIIETYGFQREDGENFRYLVKFYYDEDYTKLQKFELKIKDGQIVWNDSIIQEYLIEDEPQMTIFYQQN